MRAEKFDLIGENVRGRHLYCRGKVEDDGSVLCGFPSSLDCLADLRRIFGLGVGEGFGGEFKVPFGAGHGRIIFGDGASELGAADSNLQALFFASIEHNAAEAFAGGQVDVQNRLLCAPEGLDCAPDDILTAGGQDLKPNIVGNDTGGLDQATGEVEICLRGGGERNLDFLVTDLDELLKETEFLLSILHQLVSVPKEIPEQHFNIPLDPANSGCHLSGRWPATGEPFR